MQTIAVRQTGHVLTNGLPVFYEETDPKLAEDSMGANLKLIEVMLRSDPRNEELLMAAAQGYCGYSYLFLEDSEPERARGLDLRGRAFGLRLMKERGVDVDDPKGAKKDEVPALFSTSQCWGSWVNLSKDDPEAIASLPKAYNLAKRAADLDRGYWFGGPDIFLGVYYASRPKML